VLLSEYARVLSALAEKQTEQGNAPDYRAMQIHRWSNDFDQSSLPQGEFIHYVKIAFDY